MKICILSRKPNNMCNLSRKSNDLAVNMGVYFIPTELEHHIFMMLILIFCTELYIMQVLN